MARLGKLGVSLEEKGCRLCLGGPLGGPCEGPLGGPLGDLLGLNDCLINSEIYVIFSFFRGAQL